MEISKLKGRDTLYGNILLRCDLCFKDVNSITTFRRSRGRKKVFSVCKDCELKLEGSEIKKDS